MGLYNFKNTPVIYFLHSFPILLLAQRANDAGFVRLFLVELCFNIFNYYKLLLIE